MNKTKSNKNSQVKSQKQQKGKRSGGNRGNRYEQPNSNKTKKVLFKYSTVISRSTTVSINNLYVFRLNSLYDPDYTGTGKQPYLFDQMSLLWFNYRVDSCKVMVTATNTTTLPVTSVMFYQPSTSVQSDSFDYFQQLPGAKSALMGPANSGTSVHQFKPFTVVPHKIYGIPKGDDTLRSSIFTNPESVVYLFLGNQCEDLSTSNTVYYNISLEYRTTMSGQYQQGDSVFLTLIPRLLALPSTKELPPKAVSHLTKAIEIFKKSEQNKQQHQQLDQKIQSKQKQVVLQSDQSDSDSIISQKKTKKQ